jgi:ATP-dependent helicase/nuclease subunit B
MSGDVGVTPFRLNIATPCPRCGYRSVCRFDPAINRYQNLEAVSKEEVLERVAAEGGER